MIEAQQQGKFYQQGCNHLGNTMSKVKLRCIESHKRTPLTDWESIFLRGMFSELSRISHCWHEQNDPTVFPTSWSWTDTWWWKHLSPVKVDTRDASQTFKAVDFHTLYKEASSHSSGWKHLALNSDRKTWISVSEISFCCFCAKMVRNEGLQQYWLMWHHHWPSPLGLRQVLFRNNSH